MWLKGHHCKTSHYNKTFAIKHSAFIFVNVKTNFKGEKTATALQHNQRTGNITEIYSCDGMEKSKNTR